MAAGATNDTHTIELTPPAGATIFTLKTLRLEALPDDALPGKGPGHAGGNFVITRLSARLIPPEQHRLRWAALYGSSCRARGGFCRWPKCRCFGGNDNVARAGAATQSSTDYGGPAGTGDRWQHQRRFQRRPFDDPHGRLRRSLVGSRFEIGTAARSDRGLEPDRRRRRLAIGGLPGDRARCGAAAGLAANLGRGARTERRAVAERRAVGRVCLGRGRLFAAQVFARRR